MLYLNSVILKFFKFFGDGHSLLDYYCFFDGVLNEAPPSTKRNDFYWIRNLMRNTLDVSPPPHAT